MALCTGESGLNVPKGVKKSVITCTTVFMLVDLRDAGGLFF